MANEEFVRVAAISDVPIGGRLCTKAGRMPIALYNIGGKIYATQNKCTHMGGPLCEGNLTEAVITCPWHKSQFDVTTGEVKAGPARKPVKTFPVEIRDTEIFVDAG